MRISFNWDHRNPTSGPQFFLHRLVKFLAQDVEVVNPGSSDIHFVFISENPAALQKIRQRGAKVIQRIDGIYFDKGNTLGDTDQLNRPIKETYELSDATIFVSEFSSKLTKKHFGEKTNTKVIHSGCDLEPVNRVRRPRIICCSSWRRHKRLKEIHDVFLQLPNHYDLLVIGKPDYQIKHKRIQYITANSFSEVRELYQEAAAFLHLCWFDACPNAVLEALSAGLPVICGNQGGTPELIRLTNGGFVAPTDTEFDFERVDLYRPPPILGVQEILDYIRREEEPSMDLSMIDIRFVAQQYISYAEQILKS